MSTDNVVAFPGDPPPDADAPAKGGGRRPKKKEPDWGLYRALLDRFALIYSTDTVYDDGTGLIMKISAMAHAYGADYVRMWKGAPTSQRREEGRRWTVLPEDVVFDPSGAADPDVQINLFRGIVLEPKRGDVEPLLELLRHLTSRASEDPAECERVMHWLLCWMAYPFRLPGIKLRCAVVMHGDEGAGKNFLFETLLEIYGEYGAAVGQDELEDKFNDWRSRKLFVLADEASSRQELVHNKNRLKALITSPTVQINPKNMPRREEANHMNIAFLSNEITPLALDNTDRRYLVVFTPPARESEFYKRLAEWRRNGGVAAWFHFLKAYKPEGFDPFAPPPVTQAKRDLIDLNRKTPERFWIDWANEELGLPYCSCSVDQAFRAYLKYAQRNGDRYPLMKPVFSRMVVRIADSLKRPVRVKQMRTRSDDGDRTTRMLLVCDPILLPGISEVDWATSTLNAFEIELRRYLFSSRSLDSDEGKGPDGA